MPECRVYAETPERAANDELELERFAASLEANADAMGAAASFDQARGTLKAFWVYLHAVWNAGVVLRSDSRLEVQPEMRAEDDIAELETPRTRFRGRLALEPDEQ
jgi:hypothetical protein